MRGGQEGVRRTFSQVLKHPLVAPQFSGASQRGPEQSSSFRGGLCTVVEVLVMDGKHLGCCRSQSVRKMLNDGQAEPRLPQPCHLPASCQLIFGCSWCCTHLQVRVAHAGQGERFSVLGITDCFLDLRPVYGSSKIS